MKISIRSSLIAALLFLAALASAQTVLVRYSAPFPSVSAQSPPFLQANPFPKLTVCQSPSTSPQCSFATTYMGNGTACPNGAQDTPDPTSLTSACQSTGDAQGNIGFWIPAGTYDYFVTIGTTVLGPYTITPGSGGGGSGAPIVAFVVAFVNQPSLIPIALNTTFNSLNFTTSCFDNSVPPVAITPNSVTLGSTVPYSLYFTFAVPQSGSCTAVGPGISTTPPPPPNQFTVSPQTIDFGSVALGQLSPLQSITLTNNMATDVTGLNYTEDGANVRDFSYNLNSTCLATLPASTSCTFQAQFSPPVNGTAGLEGPAIISVMSSQPTQTVSLKGTSFDNTPPQNVTLTFTNGNGQGSGNVATLAPDGSIACSVQISPPTSGTCSASYPQGTVVTFTATPSGGGTFGGYGGITCAAFCMYTLNANTTVSVIFNPPASAAPIALVQSTNLVTVGRFSQPQTAGDMNFVVASWQDNSTTITSVQDTAGNTYTLVPGLNATKAGTAGSSSFAQDGPAINNGSKTCTMNHAAGDLVLVPLYATNTVGASYAVANSGGMSAGPGSPFSWKTTSLRQFTGNEDGTLFYAIAPSTVTGDTITASYTGSGFPTSFRIGCVNFSGAKQDVNTVLDAADNSFLNAASTTATMTTTAITTVGSNDMIFMFCSDVSTGASGWTANGSWGFIGGERDNGFAFNAADQLNIGAGTYTPTMNGSNTNRWQCIAAPFVSAAGGSTAGLSESVYYSSDATGIAGSAGGNTVSVTWSGATPPGAEVTAYEYSGVQNGSGVIDGTPAAGTGSSTSPSSGNTIAGYTNDLLFCATNALASISANASGFTQISIDSLMLHDVEEQYAVGAGTYACAPTLSGSAHWITEMVALKGSATTLPPPISEPLTLTCRDLGNGSVQTSIGGLDVTCVAGVGTESASILKGTQVNLTAVASPPSTFGGFTGGGCSSNPACIVTMNSPTTVQASFVLKGAISTMCLLPSIPYSATNRPPASCPFYSLNPASLSAWPLPIDIVAQRAIEQAPGQGSGGPAGDSMAHTAWLSGGTLSEGQADAFSYVYSGWATPGSDDQGRALYIDSSPTHNYFNLVLSGITTPGFHAPQPSWWSTIATDSSQGDGSAYWLDAVGRPPSFVIAASYWNHSSPPCNLGPASPTCSGGSSGFNSPPGHQIAVSNESGAAKNVFTDQDWGTPNGWKNTQGDEGSAGVAPMDLTIRTDELEYCGTDYTHCINHAVSYLVDCNGTYTGSGTYSGATKVFPSLFVTVLCSDVSGSPTGYPPQGAHLYLDYTDAQIAAMPIPTYAKGIVYASSHYGGYFTIASLAQGHSITSQEGYESGLARQVQTGGVVIPCTSGAGHTGFCISGGTPDPIYAFLASQGVPCNGGSGTSTCKYPLFFWGSVGSLTGPQCGSPCAIGSHWHMADPCVSVGLTGGAIGWPSGFNTPPASCVGGIFVTIAGTGTGTISSSPSGIITVGNIARISAVNSTSITLTAHPQAGHTFSWGGACSGSSTCVLTVNGTPSGSTLGTKIVTLTFN